ncbi:RNA-directed DNA polymerase, eukaryota, reverse transcriptase zinc-binding domain protein [Tanacetum coccineum]
MIMGDNEWIEVRRKNCGSVFNRLQFPHSKPSMMNDLAKVSLSVYVSNFPSHLTVREIWNICSKAGTLVDVYIAKHKNSLGQMFGFCRYIKVSNHDSLINSLCKIWIGKLRLYANVARFGKKLGNKPTFSRAQVVKPAIIPRTNPKATMASSFVNVARGSSNGEAKSPNTVHEGTGSHIPSIILSQDNSNDFPLALLGCYKDFRAIASTRSMCHNEGFSNVDFKYLGGLWVLFDFESSEARDKFLNHKGILTWFSTLKPWYNDFVVDERLVWLEIEGVPIHAWDNQVFNKICSRWGEVIFIDDTDVCNRLSKRLCIKSTHANLIFVSIMVTLNNVTYTTRVRELCSWTPTFASLENDSYEDNSVGDFVRNDEECNGDNDIDLVLRNNLSGETKMLQVDLWMLRQILGNVHFDFVYLQSGMLVDILFMEFFGLSYNLLLFVMMFPHAIGLVLEKGIPDHRPILIKKAIVDYGPTPFRFFHFWLEIEGFHELVVQTWKNDGIVDGNGFVLFKKKLQNLKKVIRVWIATRKADAHEDFKIRRDSLAILGDLDRIEAKDFAQKAKIKWGCLGIGGDRCQGAWTFHLSFFYGYWIPFEEYVVSICLKSIPYLMKFEIIGKLLANRLSNVIGDCFSSIQSAFIKGRYILDGPLILNEILAKCRHQNKELLLFKVNFEKAFDSVRWDFLDAVMGKMGFGAKWRSWISGCLHKAHSSILVNGSPTNEFELFKGLRQGDPLSSFLFILVMEGLHSLTCKAEELGLFKGVSIGCDNMNISHLMYADAVIFFGEWSWVNAQNLISMLRCFYLISGLKINIDKRKSECKLEPSVNWVRINTILIPSYPLRKLGFSPLEVGFRSLRWCLRSGSNDVDGLDKVGENVCRVKKKGGLGIGSIYGLNIGLLFKWIWRFLTHPLDLWAHVIRSVYGHNGGIFNDSHRRLKHSTWGTILSSVKWLKAKSIRTPILMFSIPFNSSSVIRRLPRGGAELNQFEALGEAIRNVSLTNQSDSWTWSIGVGYSVASTRVLVDEKLLDSSLEATRWIRIEVSSLLCPTCQIDVETVNHIFFNCEMEKDLWSLLAKWWELDIPFCSNISDWYDWLDDACVAANIRLVLEGGGTLMWAIWSFRNHLIFSNPPPKNATL